jgi:RNA polymerase-interacting CarD/CdnL/TRCF family regulator
VKVGVEAVKGVVSLPSPALQLLLPTSKARKAGVRKSANARRVGEGTAELDENRLTWNMRQAGPLWIRHASFNAQLSEAP